MELFGQSLDPNPFHGSERSILERIEITRKTTIIDGLQRSRPTAFYPYSRRLTDPEGFEFCAGSSSNLMDVISSRGADGTLSNGKNSANASRNANEKNTRMVSHGVKLVHSREMPTTNAAWRTDLRVATGLCWNRWRRLSRARASSLFN
jgi:hypothetical protein